MMFSVSFSFTDQVTLDVVIAQVQQHENVIGIVIAGSYGRDALKPESDYDLVVVLREYSHPMHVILTTIDERMTDIAFWSESQLDAMLTIDQIVANTAQSAVFNWVKTGTIVYDATGKLQKVHDHKLDLTIGNNERDKFNLWYKINFNLYHGERMLQSDDDVYLSAMDMRFLYMLLEVLDAYLITRGIPQRGEKYTIRYLKEHAPDDLTLYLSALQASDRQAKFAYYKQFAQIALEPIGGLWGTNKVTAFNLHEDMPLDEYSKLLDFWQDLLGLKS